MANQEIVIEPQAGPQTLFLSSQADIALYGGAAGGGKSWALEAEPLRHLYVPRFGGVIFRRNTTQIRNKGGLWDQSKDIYGAMGARPREATLEWFFTSGMTMKFAHLEHENTIFEWQGAEVPYIGFDELTHFTRKQFLYMLSRNRSTCGVRPYVRATCNPDPDSFVRDLVDWYIDKDGWPIQERSGILRYFLNIEDEFRWADTPDELKKAYGHKKMPLSFTFIPAKLSDNQILMLKDPSYEAKLDALTKVDQMRLKEGNWNYRAQAGDYFSESMFPIVDEIPGGFIRAVRAWDRAATKPNPQNPNPDWTEGLLLFSYPDGSYCVGDLKSIQDSPGNVKKFIKRVASHDGPAVMIRAYQDPASAGKMEAEDFVKSLQGFNVETLAVSNKKHVRAKPVASQAQVGGIKVLRADWNKRFFKQLGDFCEDETKYDHDDIVDALSLAYYFGKVNLESFSDEVVSSFENFMNTGRF
ncbi:MAG TPA: phage terminase large subunit [Candidatus Sulfotelmatobacter sp.]|nr:phage terminase large subunit [Candidatus Sulfotelmatobacter sp.]